MPLPLPDWNEGLGCGESPREPVVSSTSSSATTSADGDATTSSITTRSVSAAGNGTEQLHGPFIVMYQEYLTFIVQEKAVQTPSLQAGL
jgi:hypothetical protein